MVIGAGSGLSTAAGFTYTGERFEQHFSDFAQKFLPMRLEYMTTQDVKLLDAELTPQIAAAIEEQAKFEADGE